MTSGGEEARQHASSQGKQEECPCQQAGGLAREPGKNQPVVEDADRGHAEQGACGTGVTKGLANGIAHLHACPAEHRPEHTAVPGDGGTIALWRLVLSVGLIAVVLTITVVLSLRADARDNAAAGGSTGPTEEGQ